MAAGHDWQVTPITGVFGAELTGGSLLLGLDGAGLDGAGLDGAGLDGAGLDGAGLGELLCEHRVLVLRDQHLSHADQVTLARSLGEPTPAHPVVPGHPDHPEILELDGALGGRNARWHTDVTFMSTPPAASVLVADEVPVTGGDTLWADMRSAYERLAAPVQALVDQLVAVHRISPLAYWGEPFDTALSRDDATELLARAASVLPVVHPVVRVHPVTGRRSLFVNPGFTSHVLDVSRVESDGLLRMLYEHSTQPELVLRHRWRDGDVVIWDNRATMHYAADDYGSTSRRMRRVTIAGDSPVGPAGFRSHTSDDPRIAVR